MGAKGVFLLLATVLCLRESSPSPQYATKTFTLEEVLYGIEFYAERMFVKWVSDTEFINQEPGRGVFKYDALNQQLDTVISEEDLIELSDYAVAEFSDDRRYVLMTGDRKKVYRYSSTAEYWIYDIKNKSLRKLGRGPLQTVIWSKKNAVAYVYKNNVYYLTDPTKPEEYIQVTTSGIPGEIYYGAPDWIYEEEVLNAPDAMWFSQEGTYLAIASFNDTLVESAVYPIYGNASDINNQYPELESIKYPKAGRTNPDVTLRVIKVGEPEVQPWLIPVPVEFVSQDYILGRVNWATDDNLIVLWLNRRQNVSVLTNCDMRKNKCSLLMEHSEPNGWIEINTPIFDKAGSRMIEIRPLYNGEQRFFHVARLDLNTLTTENLSPGNSTVTEILGWDEDTDTVYYIVSPGHIPWQRQLWATTKGVVRCITCKDPSCHYVTGMFSLGGSFGVVTCSLSNVPPKVYLYHCGTDEMILIKDTPKLSGRLKHYKLPPNLFNVIQLGNNQVAHVKLSLPPNMVEGKKYPMVLRVYSGPGTTRVKDAYDMEFYTWYLSSNRSFIAASIDVRGSGAMGVEAMHAVNLALGTVEVTDTLDAIKRLVQIYPFIDPKRVGVWGWSYGGYASTMMLMKDEDKSLACAAAVAPVTSWLYYDTIYTERFMDTPQKNPEGYQRADVIPLAEKLRGRKYLLIHGTGDDNVHFQHSLQLAKELQLADIDFEEMSYTDENHSLLKVTRHFYHMLEHFWTKCFNSTS